MDKCSICSGKSLPFHEITKSEFGVTMTAKYDRCSNCGSIYITNPQPNPDYYNDQYFEKFKKFAEEGESFKLLVIREKLVKDFALGFGSVLDYGCGAGDFLHHINLKNNLFKATGIEINPSAVAFIKENYPEIEVVSDLREVNGTLYDVVTSFDIIEHFVHPQSMLQYLDHHLKPGGIMVISTPFLTQDAVYPNQFEQWRHCRPAEHFVHLTMAGMFQLICDMPGYEILHRGFEEDAIRKPGEDALCTKNIMTFVVKKPHQSE